MLFLILTFITGIVLGIVFFYGLWITVNKAVQVKIPALWFLGSSLIRVAIVITGFYLISRGNWQKLLICLFGFITARFLVKKFTNKKMENQFQLVKGASDES